MTNRRRLSTVVLALVFAFALPGCTPTGGIPARPPTFLDVVSTADGLRTGYRADSDTADWRFFMHDDLFDGNDTTCGDMAVAPDGIMRHLALLRRAQDGSWSLRIRTGLGPATWSSTLSTIAVPAIQSQDGFPVSTCQRVRMAHLRDNLFGVIWAANGVLNNAVFTAGAEPPADLALGAVFPLAGIGNISANSGSLVAANNNAHFIFSNPERTRIHTISGTMASGGITFLAGATTDVPHDALSDVVVQNNALFAAVRQGNNMRLLRKTGGADWEQVASCETTATGIRGRLLFADVAGDFWVGEVIGTGVSRLRNFNGCGSRNFVLPILTGLLRYHPGSP